MSNNWHIYIFAAENEYVCYLKYSKDIDEVHLILLIKQGSKEAFEGLYEKYADRIYHFTLSYLKNGPDAEELVQEVFLKIWEKRETLDQTKNIKAFVFKVAINTIYDVIRRRNIENAFKDFAALNYETESNSTWHTVIYEEMQAKMNRLVKQFPDQRRKIFRLSKEEGLSNEEIAVKLNLSKRTVENQLYRAVSILKEQFKNESLLALFFFYLFIR